MGNALETVRLLVVVGLDGKAREQQQVACTAVLLVDGWGVVCAV